MIALLVPVPVPAVVVRDIFSLLFPVLRCWLITLLVLVLTLLLDPLLILLVLLILVLALLLDP
ncbi:MAG: hypothetical protein ABIT70_06180, partial [Sulfuriferula sp.]